MSTGEPAQGVVRRWWPFVRVSRWVSPQEAIASWEAAAGLYLVPPIRLRQQLTLRADPLYDT